MWPFTRRDRRPDDGAASPRPHDAWREVDPLQPTVGPAPLTLPASFYEGLAGHQGAPLALEPLGHRVSLDAPAGLVRNLATPIASRTDGPELVPRPRVKPRPDAQRAAMSTGPAASDLPEAEAVARPAVNASPPDAPRLTRLDPEATVAPVRSIPTTAMVPVNIPAREAEEADASPAVPAMPVAAPPSRLSLGQTRRLGLGAPIARVPPPQRAPEPGEPEMPAVVPAPPPASVVSPAAGEAPSQTGPPAAAAGPFAAFVAAAARATGSEAGSPAAVAPLPMTLATPPVRSAEAVTSASEPLAAQAPSGPEGPTPSAAGDRPPAASIAPLLGSPPLVTATGVPPAAAEAAPSQPSDLADLGLRTRPDTAPASAGSPAGAAPLAMPLNAPSAPGDRMPASATDDAEPGPASASDDAEPAPAAGEEPSIESAAGEEPMIQASRRAPDPPMASRSELIAPLTSARPLRPTEAAGREPVQRAPESVPTPLRTRLIDAFGIDPGEARVHRDGAASSQAHQLRARAFTQSSEVYLPAEQGPLESTGTQALLAHELTHVAQQRRLGQSLPAENSPLGQRLEADAQDVERSWHADAVFPLAAPRRQAASPEEIATPVSSAPLVSAGMAGWTAGDGFSSASAGASGARAAIDPTPIQAARPGEAPLHAGPAPGAAHAPDAPPGRDLDELARQLYDRIRSRLKNEL
ncbi:MAG TPA: DUF4157 domain-containing protein, partial [Candidatus Limnocylindrales bacterium]|nr:DUF4157 domain-containing protein [Candidatus Limnocylindrales bacterium]